MNHIPLESRTKLNLGCGRKPFADHINLDVVASVNPDVVHDLDRYPYPFPDSRFEEIAVYDVVEHIGDVSSFMREIWRIGRHGATVKISTPHFSASNAYTDPTHRRHLGYFSFDYFTAGNPLNFYGSEGFKISKRTINFRESFPNKFVNYYTRRWPDKYEQRWAWIFPAYHLYYELEVVKD